MLLDFVFGSESHLTATGRYAPLTSAFIVLKGIKGFILLKNKYRGLWELPGGMIDAGGGPDAARAVMAESPRQCVIRECREESGQIMVDPEFVGLARLAFAADAYRERETVEYVALYGAWLDTLRRFHENDEISALRWYQPGDVLEDVCSVSLDMIGFYESRSRAGRG